MIVTRRIPIANFEQIFAVQAGDKDTMLGVYGKLHMVWRQATDQQQCQFMAIENEPLYKGPNQK